MKLSKKERGARWLFSYLVIILCLFTAMAVIIGIYSTSLKKEMDEFNEFVFESVAASVNDVLSDVNDLHVNIARNDKLRRLTMFTGDFYRSQLTYDVIGDLVSYGELANNVDHFFIYLKNTDTILSYNGVVDSKTFFNYYFKRGNVEYEDWKNLFYNFENDEYISMKCVNKSDKLIDSIGFLFQVSADNPNAVGVILCDKKHFMNNIEKIEWKSLCDIYIYNGQGKLMLYDKNSDDGEVPKTLKEAEKYAEKSNIVFKKSVAIDKYYWQLMCVVPKEALNSTIHITQCVIIGIVIFSLILLVFLVKYLLKMNRKPILSVLSLFGATEEKNEYEALHRLVNETLTKNNNLLNNLKNRDRELKTIAISKIIKGDMPRSALAEYNIEFQSENYAVISFFMEDLSTFFPEDTAMPNFEKSYHLRYNINNVMEELCSQENICVYTTEIDQNIVSLANLGENTTVDALTQAVQKGVEFINSCFDIQLRYAISDIYSTFSELSVAYAQTVRILEYKRIMKTDDMISFSQLSELKAGQYIFDLKNEEKLVHFLKIGSTQEALAQAALLFKELAMPGRYSTDYIRYAVLDVAITVTKCAHELLQNSDDIEYGITLCKSVLQSVDLAQMQSEIERYIEKVCEITNIISRRKKRQKCNAEEIRNYVHENLTDFNLSAVSVGAYFGITAAYVSKLFKDETGISLTDYISKKRIERGCELLAEGKYSIREISEMVGFSNERTFYRAQKKFRNS